MKFKISNNHIGIYTFLLLILPIMDSLNGLINGGQNEGGLSLGIIYRLLIICVSFFYWFKFRIRISSFIYLLFLFILFIVSIIATSYSSITQYSIMLLRLILPIIIIFTIRILYINHSFNKQKLKIIFNYWLVLFPITIFLAYILGIGFSTYSAGTTSAVGFKGLYTSQNDISYILDILYLFVLFKLKEKINFSNITELFMVLVSSLLIGLKGNYLIIIFLTLVFIFKIHGFKKYLWILLIILGVIAFIYLFAENFQIIVNRWQYFYYKNDFWSFLTSNRSDRILPIYNWIKENYGIKALFFGSGYSYLTSMVGPYQIVEMDPVDILFQLGLIGFILIYGFYFRIIISRYKHNNFFSYAAILSIIISTLSGHVLEDALSGVCFALILGGLMFNKENMIIQYKEELS